jgi:hypothetical protein
LGGQSEACPPLPRGYGATGSRRSLPSGPAKGRTRWAGPMAGSERAFAHPTKRDSSRSKYALEISPLRKGEVFRGRAASIMNGNATPVFIEKCVGAGGNIVLQAAARQAPTANTAGHLPPTDHEESNMRFNQSATKTISSAATAI